jgi:exodeoxyribonuclease X
MELFVIDLETTGFEPGSVVEVAVVGDGFKHWSSLVRPTTPIEFDAMAAHHITPAMVADAPEWEFVHPRIPREGVFVAHNAAFDKKFLPPDIQALPTICTYRSALHLLPDAPSHKNQALRYMLDLDVSSMPPEAGSMAHRALYDAWITRLLLEHLLTLASAEELVKLTTTPVILKKFRFGKHRDEPVASIPRSYMRWLLNSDFAKEDMDILATAQRYA